MAYGQYDLTSGSMECMDLLNQFQSPQGPTALLQKGLRDWNTLSPCTAGVPESNWKHRLGGGLLRLTSTSVWTGYSHKLPEDPRWLRTVFSPCTLRWEVLVRTCAAWNLAASTTCHQNSDGHYKQRFSNAARSTKEHSRKLGRSEIKQLHMREISRSSPPWKAGFCWAMCAACTGSSLNISEKTTPRLKTSHAKVTTESGRQYCWQVMGGTSLSTGTGPKSIMNTLRWSSSMKWLGLMSQWTKPKCARCSTLSSIPMASCRHVSNSQPDLAKNSATFSGSHAEINLGAPPSVTAKPMQGDAGTNKPT